MSAGKGDDRIVNKVILCAHFPSPPRTRTSWFFEVTGTRLLSQALTECLLWVQQCLVHTFPGEETQPLGGSSCLCPLGSGRGPRKLEEKFILSVNHIFPLAPITVLETLFLGVEGGESHLKRQRNYT